MATIETCDLCKLLIPKNDCNARIDLYWWIRAKAWYPWAGNDDRKQYNKTCCASCIKKIDKFISSLEKK